MNKLLLIAAFAGAFSLSASAIHLDAEPVQGVINLEADPAGISSIEFTGEMMKANRECKEFAVLKKNGEILKEVPASNERLVYTFIELTKFNYGYGHITFFENPQSSPARQPGNYSVYIPEGYFLVGEDETPSSAATYRYIINGFGEITASPAPGGVQELYQIKLTFPEGCELEYNSYSGEGDKRFTPIALENKNFRVAITDIKIDGNVVTLTLPQPVTTEGQYTLRLYKNCFFVKVNGQQQEFDDDRTFNYTIEPERLFFADPAPDTYSTVLTSRKVGATSASSVAESYAFFTVDMPEGTKIQMTLMGRPQLAPIVDGEPVVSNSNTYFSMAKNADGTKLFLLSPTPAEKTRESEIKVAPGEYALVIPANSIQFVGSRNTLINLGRYLFEDVANGILDYIITPTPDEELTEISTITIEFPNAASVECSPSEWVTMTCGTKQYDTRASQEDNKVVIRFTTPIEAAGEWTLFISGQTLKVDGVNTPINATFRIKGEDPGEEPGDESAVEAIEVETEAEYYNLQGLRVANPGNGIFVKVVGNKAEKVVK